MHLNVVGIDGQRLFFLLDGFVQLARLFQFHTGPNVRLRTSVQIVNAFEEGVVERRLSGGNLLVGGKLLIRFGGPAEAAELTSKGKMGRAVGREQIAGFGIGLRSRSMIAKCGLHPA